MEIRVAEEGERTCVTFQAFDDDGKRIGGCYISLTRAYGGGKVVKSYTLWALFVEEAYRRQGIATRLLKEVDDFLEDNVDGETTLELYVDSHNTPALRLYEKAGFILPKRDSRDWRMYKLIQRR